MNGSVTSVEIKTIKKFRLCINSAMIASFALNPKRFKVEFKWFKRVKEIHKQVSYFVVF